MYFQLHFTFNIYLVSTPLFNITFNNTLIYFQLYFTWFNLSLGNPSIQLYFNLLYFQHLLDLYSNLLYFTLHLSVSFALLSTFLGIICHCETPLFNFTFNFTFLYFTFLSTLGTGSKKKSGKSVVFY